MQVNNTQSVFLPFLNQGVSLVDLKRALDLLTLRFNTHRHTGSDLTKEIVDRSLFKEIVTKTAAYTATVEDCTILCDATSAAFSVTLPNALNAKYQILHIKKIDSSVNAVTVDGYSSETIDGATTQALSSQWDSITIHSNGTAWYKL